MDYIITQEDLLPSINSTEIIQHEQISTENSLSRKCPVLNSIINKTEQYDEGIVDVYIDTLPNEESLDDSSTIKQENNSSDEHNDVTETSSVSTRVSKKYFQ